MIPEWENNSLISNLCKKISRMNVGRVLNMDAQDLYQEGWLVYNKCCKTYTPANGNFLTYFRRAFENHIKRLVVLADRLNKVEGIYANEIAVTEKITGPDWDNLVQRALLTKTPLKFRKILEAIRNGICLQKGDKRTLAKLGGVIFRDRVKFYEDFRTFLKSV
jgi:DNA-directed RNA polymerase specialized sigma24 family protein